MSVIIRKPTKEEIEKSKKWKIWTKGISAFDMKYVKTEYCLIIDGEVKIVTEDKNYYFKGGDYVIFKKGLECIWVIKSPVKKYYLFEDR